MFQEMRWTVETVAAVDDEETPLYLRLNIHATQHNPVSLRSSAQSYGARAALGSVLVRKG